MFKSTYRSLIEIYLEKQKEKVFFDEKQIENRKFDFLIAPDGEIPNSVIRKTLSGFVAPFEDLSNYFSRRISKKKAEKIDFDFRDERNKFSSFRLDENLRDEIFRILQQEENQQINEIFQRLIEKNFLPENFSAEKKFFDETNFREIQNVFQRFPTEILVELFAEDQRTFQFAAKIKNAAEKIATESKRNRDEFDRFLNEKVQNLGFLLH